MSSEPYHCTNELTPTTASDRTSAKSVDTTVTHNPSDEPASSSQAGPQLAATFELVEQILLQLPTKDLLLSQRVSKHWAQIIQQSNKLQRALFFEPIDLGPIVYTQDKEGVFKWQDENGAEPEIWENTLAWRLFNFIYCSSSNNDTWSWPSWSCPQASWRRMIPAQPAICVEYRITEMGEYGNMFPVTKDKVRYTGTFDTRGRWLGDLLVLLKRDRQRSGRKQHRRLPTYESVGDGTWKALQKGEDLDSLRALEIAREKG